jgi:hypothetical protein
MAGVWSTGTSSFLRIFEKSKKNTVSVVGAGDIGITREMPGATRESRWMGCGWAIHKRVAGWSRSGEVAVPIHAQVAAGHREPTTG